MTGVGARCNGCCRVVRGWLMKTVFSMRPIATCLWCDPMAHAHFSNRLAAFARASPVVQPRRRALDQLGEPCRRKRGAAFRNEHELALGRLPLEPPQGAQLDPGKGERGWRASRPQAMPEGGTRARCPSDARRSFQALHPPCHSPRSLAVGMPRSFSAAMARRLRQPAACSSATTGASFARQRRASICGPWRWPSTPPRGCPASSACFGPAHSARTPKGSPSAKTAANGRLRHGKSRRRDRLRGRAYRIRSAPGDRQGVVGESPSR
jgi:hypothetical protein